MRYSVSLPGFTAAACMLALLCCVWLPPAHAAPADVRILVDVSGSMKQNDPQNLRIPAMQLIAGLLPAGTTAGVWLFAEKSDVLLKSAKVDDAWREQARNALPKIHSRGLFTHIEDVLGAAMQGWEEGDGHPPRHIVLLTDGVVDVSKNADESKASRKRILDEQIARLETLGAQVHAVALSDNVDKELMNALTSRTGGWLERADDAEKLQRIFLHMLEQAAPPVTVPLNGNRFELDDSVSELTLLVFREDGEKATKKVTVTPPGGAPFSASKHPDGVQWKSEPGYDLITVAAPTAGEWSFDGAIDPDNRAVIVTDLALELGNFPSTLLASEAATLSAKLTAEGEPLKRIELLELVKGTTALGNKEQPGDAVTGTLALNAETAAFEGEVASLGLAAGVYDLAVTLDGGTFKRQINKRVRFAADPVTLSYATETAPASAAAEQPAEHHAAEGGEHAEKPAPAATATAVVLEVTPDPELTRAGSLAGYIVVTDGAEMVRAIPLPALEDGVARLRIEASHAGAHVVAPHFFVETKDGRLLDLEPAAQTFDLAYTPPATVEETAPAEEAPTPAFSWLTLAAVVGGGNVLLAASLGLVWWFMGRRGASRNASTAGAPA